MSCMGGCVHFSMLPVLTLGAVADSKCCPLPGLLPSGALTASYRLANPGAGEFGEALEALSQVQRQDWTADAGFAAWLARCHIMTGK